MEYFRDNRRRDAQALLRAGQRRTAGKPKRSRSRNKYTPKGLPTREQLIILEWDPTRWGTYVKPTASKS
jgi:hypothetical protein